MHIAKMVLAVTVSLPYFYYFYYYYYGRCYLGHCQPSYSQWLLLCWIFIVSMALLDELLAVWAFELVNVSPLYSLLVFDRERREKLLINV